MLRPRGNKAVGHEGKMAGRDGSICVLAPTGWRAGSGSIATLRDDGQVIGRRGVGLVDTTVRSIITGGDGSGLMKVEGAGSGFADGSADAGVSLWGSKKDKEGRLGSNATRLGLASW